MVSPTASCLSRLGQVLSAVEDSGIVTRAELQTHIDASVCVAGHELRMASMANHLVASGLDDALTLTTEGANWLMEFGRPSPDWLATAVHGPALRPWQVAALEAWSQHGRRGVVQAVTGTGKSRVGTEAIREALGHDYSCVVVVPTIDLVEQWARQLKAAGIPDVGRSTDGAVTFSRHRVIVGTVSSLYLAPPTRQDGKVLLVADECHRYGAEQWGKVLCPSYRRRLGLTATFERNDDGLDALQAYFHGRPVYEIGFRQAIAEGAVAHYDVTLLGVDLTASEQAAYDEADETARDMRSRLLAAGFPSEPFGRFIHEVGKSAEFDEDPTIEDAARAYLKAFSRRIDVMTNAQAKVDVVPRLAPIVRRSHGALVFTRRVDAAQEIADLLRDEGIKAAAVHGELSRVERRDRLSELRAGALDALVAPTVLDEGIDVPDVDLAIVMGGSKSRRQMIQRMGRVLRLKRGGGKAAFLVVYARGTAEDLSRESGAEGCLDLIVEAADSVTHADSVDGLAGDRVIPQAPTAVSALAVDVPSGGVHPKPTARRNAPVSGANHARLQSVSPELLPMTRKALADYQHAHGADETRAEAAMRELLAAMKTSSMVRDSRTPGVFVARRDGFELAVSIDRFAGYRSLRSDGLTWAELSQGPGDPGGPALQPVALSQGNGVPLRDDRPTSEVMSPIAVDQHAAEASAARKVADTVLPISRALIADESAGVSTAGSTRSESGSEFGAGANLMAHLERLVELHENGLLTEPEFAAAKRRLLF